MKILQISNYFYPHIGGIEQTARDISAAIGERCEQKIFCFNHAKGDESGLVNGTEVIRAGCFAKVSSQSLSFSYGKLLKKTFTSFCPDVVIFHFPNPFGAHYVLKLLRRYPGCKLILYWHLDIVKQKILKLFFGGQTRRLLARAQTVVATSPNYIAGSAQLQSVKEKCVVIPSCVSADAACVTEEIRARAAQIRTLYAGKTICFALGRHVPYKGMEYLVRAGALLDDRFRILIGGSGPLTPSLKEMAEHDEKVIFLGRLEEEEKKAYLLACDIFCFPSVTKNEAFGLALAEAMTYGKPAVTFTIAGSGVNYVSLNGVTGIEVPNADAEAYAAALRVLSEDGALRERYGANAAARAAELFTYGSFRRNILALLGLRGDE